MFLFTAIYWTFTFSDKSFTESTSVPGIRQWVTLSRRNPLDLLLLKWGGAGVKEEGKLGSEVDEKKKSELSRERWEGVRKGEGICQKQNDNLVHGGRGQCQVRSDKPESQRLILRLFHIFSIQMSVWVFCQHVLSYISSLTYVVSILHIFSPFGCFNKILLKWRGSVYKLIYKVKDFFVVAIFWTFGISRYRGWAGFDIF